NGPDHPIYTRERRHLHLQKIRPTPPSRTLTLAPSSRGSPLSIQPPPPSRCPLRAAARPPVPPVPPYAPLSLSPSPAVASTALAVSRAPTRGTGAAAGLSRTNDGVTDARCLLGRCDNKRSFVDPGHPKGCLPKHARRVPIFSLDGGLDLLGRPFLKASEKVLICKRRSKMASEGNCHAHRHLEWFSYFCIPIPTMVFLGQDIKLGQTNKGSRRTFHVRIHAIS
ncbi:unnamed protein product, partial [Urochloa humidicola]